MEWAVGSCRSVYICSLYSYVAHSCLTSVCRQGPALKLKQYMADDSHDSEASLARPLVYFPLHSVLCPYLCSERLAGFHTWFFPQCSHACFSSFLAPLWAFVQREKGTISHFIFPTILLEGRVAGKKSNRREEGREGVEGRVF